MVLLVDTQLHYYPILQPSPPGVVETMEQETEGVKCPEVVSHLMVTFIVARQLENVDPVALLPYESLFQLGLFICFSTAFIIYLF